MQVIATIEELREVKRSLCRDIALSNTHRPTVGFVPTMGNLHEGHLALIGRMREESDVSVVSIFVNPTQFGPQEDFDRYPRTLYEDLAKCQAVKVDLVFTPGVNELYLPGRDTEVLVKRLSERFCGAARPGHFAGVALVVAKLFNIVQPDRAYFGQKDFQQFRIIERMVADLDFAVDLIMCPTVREPDGLAMSSRNSYLAAGERMAAATIYAGLKALAAAFGGGEQDAHTLKSIARAALADAVKVEYLEIAEAETLTPREAAQPGDVALIAAHVGTTRLIDNLILEAGENDAA